MWRPRTTRVVAYATAGAIIVLMIVLAVVLAPAFQLADRLLMIALGLFLAWILHMLGRCRVEARDDGLTIVNAFRTRRLTWPEVVDATMNPGDPWPTLDLTDGTTVSAMGINGSERTRATTQFAELHALVRARSAAPGPG